AEVPSVAPGASGRPPRLLKKTEQAPPAPAVESPAEEGPAEKGGETESPQRPRATRASTRKKNPRGIRIKPDLQ
ncbi:MAG: hypothetical protein WBP72_18225, partial [Rhodocyclaceae bacterium]